MDPLSIASACVGITAVLSTLMMRIGVFVAETKNARKDLDAVHRELSSLQLCLNALRSDELSGKSTVPADLRDQIGQILVNIEMTINQINNMLIKLGFGRLGRSIQWATMERSEMNQLRSSLESKKAALEIALTVGTISILVEQRSRNKTQDGRMTDMTQMMKVIAVNSTNMSGKIDDILTLQRQNLGLTDIQAALDDLRLELTAILGSGTKTSALRDFSGQAVTHIETLLVPVTSEVGHVLDIPKASDPEPSPEDLDHHTVEYEELDATNPPRTCIACKQELSAPGSIREMRDYEKKYEEKKQKTDKYISIIEHINDVRWLEQKASAFGKELDELAEASSKSQELSKYDRLGKTRTKECEQLESDRRFVYQLKMSLKSQIARLEQHIQVFKTSRSADLPNAHQESHSLQSSATGGNQKLYQARSHSKFVPESAAANVVSAPRSLAEHRKTGPEAIRSANIFENTMAV